jgi:hypothetical protein
MRTLLSVSGYLIVAEDCHRMCSTNDGNAGDINSAVMFPLY